MSETKKIMVIGASGQIGTDLVEELRERYGNKNVLASDIKTSSKSVRENGPFEILDAMDILSLRELIKKYHITEVYLLAALLSAKAEEKQRAAWSLNMESLLHVLDLAKEGLIKKVFWPSSIAVFGPTTPRENTPQSTITEPASVYGISKLAGERWCEYYHKKYSVDVRSIRYPGLIGYKSLPGGGTTDYAVQIFHDALDKGHHECFLKEDASLPMMYMPDAIRATIQLMDADPEKLSIRSSYNISGISFSPAEIAAAIQKIHPDFTVSYQPDYRQELAASWPKSIDDSVAQKDWNWKAKYDLDKMVKDMFDHLPMAEHHT